VFWDDKDNDGVLDPRLQSDFEPGEVGGHAMLVVGYHRLKEYLIVKNSWGSGWGHGGYAYFHYDYARTYFKYGYVISDVVAG
jgi:C1A family cysteine protease